jgi:hypothetical protein
MRAESTAPRTNGQSGLAGKAHELATELLGAASTIAEARDHVLDSVSAIRDSITENVEERARLARRALRRGRNTAEDLVDTATLRVRRDPISSVALAFASGAIAGSMVTIVLGRLWRRD